MNAIASKSFKDKIWSADLPDIQLISKYNKGFRFLIRVTNIFSEYHGLFL